MLLYDVVVVRLLLFATMAMDTMDGSDDVAMMWR